MTARTGSPIDNLTGAAPGAAVLGYMIAGRAAGLPSPRLRRLNGVRALQGSRQKQG